MSDTLEATVGGPAAAVLAAGSRARGARVFHPDGAAYTARVLITSGDFGLGAATGTHLGMVRLSRGIGLPAPLPDFLGLALRIYKASSPAEHQDLLLASSASPFPLRHLLVPARHFGSPTYSSLTRFRTPDGTLVTVEARPDGSAMQYDLLVATGTGPPSPIGSVVLDQKVPDSEGQALRFDVWRNRGLLEPVGWLNRLRRPAYRASQAARPDTG